MMSTHGVLLLHRGVVGHPLWLNGLPLPEGIMCGTVDVMYGHPLVAEWSWLNGHCQRVDNGVSPWMICMVSAHGVLLLHRGVVGQSPWLNGLTHCHRVDHGVSP